MNLCDVVNDDELGSHLRCCQTPDQDAARIYDLCDFLTTVEDNDIVFSDPGKKQHKMKWCPSVCWSFDWFAK